MRGTAATAFVPGEGRRTQTPTLHARATGRYQRDGKVSGTPTCARKEIVVDGTVGFTTASSVITFDVGNGNSRCAFGGTHRCTWQDAVTRIGEIDRRTQTRGSSMPRPPPLKAHRPSLS